MTEAYSADRSLKGKLRRRVVRLQHRRPLRTSPARPMISFSFDDAPVSATERGAAILEEAGIRGTYYISAGLMGREGPMGMNADAEAVKALAGRGHDVACHTYSHLDCGQADAAAIADNVDRNDAALSQIGLPTRTSFAYPYGDVSLQAKTVLSDRYRLLRALSPGLVQAGTDLNQAPAVGVEGDGGEAAALSWMAKAKARNAWVILYSHDVDEAHTAWGTSPAILSRLVGRAKAMDFDIVTVAEGLRRLDA